MTPDNQYTQELSGLLKKVYEAHRNALKESNTNCLKYKAQCQRLTDKSSQLCVENELLKTENYRLQSTVSLKTPGSGTCCEVIRQSLDTVISSYRQLLQEKECRIKQLERDNTNLRQQCGLACDLFASTTETSQVSDTSLNAQTSRENVGIKYENHHPQPVKETATPLFIDEQSTNKPGNRENDQSYSEILQSKSTFGNQTNFTYGKLSVSPDAEDLSRLNEAGNQSQVDGVGGQKLKLQRSGKRSRYLEEEVSPEVKRPRQVSPESSTRGHKSEGVPEPTTAPRILVPDTCRPDLDETLPPQGLQLGSNDDKKNVTVCSRGGQGKNKPSSARKARQSSRDSFDQSLLVVPETVPMDFDDEFDDDDEEEEDLCGARCLKDDRFVPELSDIAEISRESKDAECGIEVGKSKGSGDRKKGHFSLRSMLSSPDSRVRGEWSSEKSGEKNSCSDATLVHASDDDSDNLGDSDSCSQTFGKPKYQARKKKVIYVDLGEEKCNEKASAADKPKENTSVKPMFRKKSKVLVDEQVLRRSPRKHKGSQEWIGKKSREEVEESSENKTNKEVISREQIDHARDKNTVAAVVNEMSFDPDATVAPEGTDTVKPTDSQFDPSQSMDCYRVVPLRHGEPVSGKSFQVKVSKDCQNVENTCFKRRAIILGNGKGKKNLEDTSVGMISGKSPSDSSRLECGDKVDKNVVLKDISSPEIGRVMAEMKSPSVGSHSDPESPLLLRLDGLGDRLKSSNVSVSRLNSSGNGCSSHKPSQQHGQTKRLSVRGNKVSRNTTNLKQTTLTQKFFQSPEKVVVDLEDDGEKIDDNAERCKEKGESDEDLQRALAESKFDVGAQRMRNELESFESKGNNKSERRGHLPVVAAVDVDKDTFKHPVMPVRGRTRAQQRAPDATSTSPLKEIPDPSNYGNHGHRLNGSLDPAVELTQWCREPTETDPVTTGTLDPSLPYLDTELCIDAGFACNPRTSTQVLESQESQYIPSSSSSYKFGAGKQQGQTSKGDCENIPPAVDFLEDSFDRLPKKPESKMAHVAVVRKKDERQKLQGHGCKQCLEYYRAAGRSDEEAREHMQRCSRHRAEYVPPDTPPHFWSIGFIDTQDCVKDDGLKFDDEPLPVANEAPQRRRRKYNKCFKSKNETSTLSPE